MISDKFESGMKRQLAAMHDALANGMTRRGWKIGINVPEVRKKLDLPHACVGWLDGDRVVSSGSRIEFATGARIHVEAELAIEVAETIDPGFSIAEIRRAIRAIHPALELVDYAQAASTLDEVVAHCMFHDSTIIGSPSPLPTSHSLGIDAPVLEVGSQQFVPDRTDLVPFEIGEIVAFAAEYLDRFGEQLEAGDLLISGSYFAAAVPLPPGTAVSADFGPIGRVSAMAAA